MATNPEDIHLQPEHKRLIAELADQRGKAWSEILEEALDAIGTSQDAQDVRSPGSAVPQTASVLDIFLEAREAIPQEELDKLPVDGADQHDHYIYGTLKSG
ncbi:MAG: hypothetical protein ACR2RB_03660 [Gammaproteobacteria bacterium]